MPVPPGLLPAFPAGLPDPAATDGSFLGLGSAVAPYTLGAQTTASGTTSRVLAVGTGLTLPSGFQTDAGDTIIVLAQINSSNIYGTACTDDAGNTYTVDCQTTSGQASPTLTAFRCDGATGGPGGGPSAPLGLANTITVTSSATTGACVTTAWGLPAQVCGPLDVMSASENIQAAVSQQTNTLTPTADNGLMVIATVTQLGPGTADFDPPFTPVYDWSLASSAFSGLAYDQLGPGTAGVAQSGTYHTRLVTGNARSFGWIFKNPQVALADAAAAVDAITASAAVPLADAAGAADALSEAVAGNAPMATIQDAFPGSTVDTSKWTAFPSAGGSVSVSGALLSLTDTASTAAFSVLQSNAAYDLTGSYLFAKLASAGNQAAATLALMKIQADANNSAQILVQNGTLAAQHQVAGSYSAFLATATYSAATHRWLRLREAGGTLFYEYSANGVTWSTLYSEASPITLTGLTASLQEGATAATDPAATSQWAQVNVLQLTDAAAAADALTVSATVGLTEPGAAAEAVAIQASVPVAEAGGAAEQLGVSAAVPLPDAGGAADQLAVQAAVPLPDAAGAADVLTTPARTVVPADAAGAVDSISVSETTSLADAAGAADSLTVTVSAPLADAAGAADQQAVQAAVPLADAGGAADVLTTPARTIVPADAGGAADAVTAAVQAPLADAGGAADSITAAVTSPIADVAGAADALTVQVGTFVSVADSAGAADSLTVSVAAPLADAAAAVDSPVVAVQAGLTDAGAAADASGVAVQAPLADQAGAADVLAPAAAVPLADAGAAADQVAVAAGAAPQLADAAGAADALAVTVQVPLADAAGAAETLSVAETTSLAEQAGAVDSLTVTVSVPLADRAAAADAGGVSAQVPLSDAGAAADSLAAVAAAQPQLLDAGAATDALSASVTTAGHDVAAASDSLAVIVGISVSVSDSAGAVDSLAVTVPTIGPAPVWRCGAAAQRWFCSVALARWLVAAAAARWETEPSPPRWAVRMLAARWEAIMAEFRPVASISKANVNVTWTSDLGGTEVDPTTAPFPVRFAFPVSSGDENAPAQPVTWFPGTWLDPQGRQQGWIAQCPVGPTADGGLVQLAKGRYDVWSEVDAGTETPREFAGVLPVY